MRSTLVGGWVIGLMIVSSTPALAAKTNYKATIEGGAVGSPGTGTGSFTFDDATKKLCGSVTYAGLTGGPVTVAALKEGDNYTVVKELSASASPLLVEVTLGDDAASLLATGPVYIAMGNAMHGVAAGADLNGEVNGELVVDPAGAEQVCGVRPVEAGETSGLAADAGLPDGGSSNGVGSSPGLAPVSNVAKPPEEGGCSTSGSSAGGVGAFALASAVIVALRSRRRR